MLLVPFESESELRLALTLQSASHHLTLCYIRYVTSSH